MEYSISLLGIARNAGRLEVGEEPTGKAARGKKARLILLAADVSDNARHRARNFSVSGNVPVLELPLTKEELGAAVGSARPSMAAITDVGLAASFAEKYAAADPEDPARQELAQQLRQTAQRVQERKRESLAHKKNVRLGKRRKNV